MNDEALGRRLLEILDDGKARGFLGPGVVDRHLEHSADLAEAIGMTPRRFLDLGSGAGIPGLVLADRWPAARAVFLDSNQRRAAFLRTAVHELGWDGRVRVVCDRAETAARDPALRAAHDLVVARGFAKPAITAECAVGFLAPNGRLVVTEPQHTQSEVETRWPEAGLRELGLGRARPVRHRETGAVVMEMTAAPDERWPRRVGRPAKAPLW